VPCRTAVARAWFQRRATAMRNVMRSF